jgi:RimJ/RimL family protein N-acetyltransferase
MNENSEDEIIIFQENVKKIFAELKFLERYDDVIEKSIRLDDNAGYLVCVSELHYNDNFTISLLSKWREAATTFHNRFEVTHEGTRQWLRDLVLDMPDKILFLIFDTYGQPIGHLGFANVFNSNGIFELDNVVRGNNERATGIMTKATITLLQWARDNISPNGFFLRTLDDNKHALKFYSKLGFTKTNKQPLRKICHEVGFSYVPIEVGDDESPDKYFIGMALNATL